MIAKQLREHAVRYANDYGYNVADDLNEAAARIEALEAALRGIAELADSDDGISPREAIEIASVALAEEQDK